jgi:hypothetical protein
LVVISTYHSYRNIKLLQAKLSVDVLHCIEFAIEKILAAVAFAASAVNLVPIVCAFAVPINQGYGALAQGALDSPAPAGLLIAGSTPIACLKTALIDKLATISRLIGVLETAVRLQVDIVQSVAGGRIPTADKLVEQFFRRGILPSTSPRRPLIRRWPA